MNVNKLIYPVLMLFFSNFSFAERSNSAMEIFNNNFVEKIEFDKLACGDKVSGVVEGDFDKDGKIDQIVLLAFSNKRTIVWNDASLNQYSFLLISNFGDGSFEILKSFVNYLPLNIYLDVVNMPLTLTENGMKINVSPPLIKMVHCEKSEEIFYFKNGSFYSVVVND